MVRRGGSSRQLRIQQYHAHAPGGRSASRDGLIGSLITYCFLLLALAPSADSTAFCVLHNTTKCWGNYHSMVEVIVDSPFDGIDVGIYSAPARADVDGDGDLDLVVGEYDGVLYFVKA